MLFSRLIVVLFLSLTLGACGMFRNNKEYAYLNAQSTKALEIPEGMIEPKSPQPLEVPDIKVNTIDLTNDLVEPPVIVRSVDLSELGDETSKTDSSAEASKDQTQATEQPALVALTSRQQVTPEGDSILLVDAGFDQVWPAVSPALVELGFTIDDSSRGGQFYTISKELVSVNIEEEVHPGDEKPPLKEEYQIHLKQVDEKTQITVHNKYGELERSGLSDHLLLQIQEILGNPVNKTSNNN
jgi:uncharacterized lipoprotein